MGSELFPNVQSAVFCMCMYVNTKQQFWLALSSFSAKCVSVLHAEQFSKQLVSKSAVCMSGCTWCVQVLRSPKEAFPAAMQSWRERCEKCVCLQGDYIEK